MNIHKTLIANSIDWYVIREVGGAYRLRHASDLSAIMQCGMPMSDYGIAAMQQCWGEDLGEDAITVTDTD